MEPTPTSTTGAASSTPTAPTTTPVVIPSPSPTPTAALPNLNIQKSPSPIITTPLNNSNNPINQVQRSPIPLSPSPLPLPQKQAAPAVTTVVPHVLTKTVAVQAQVPIKQFSPTPAVGTPTPIPPPSTSTPSPSVSSSTPVVTPISSTPSTTPITTTTPSAPNTTTIPTNATTPITAATTTAPTQIQIQTQLPPPKSKAGRPSKRKNTAEAGKEKVEDGSEPAAKKPKRDENAPKGKPGRKPKKLKEQQGESGTPMNTSGTTEGATEPAPVVAAPGGITPEGRIWTAQDDLLLKEAAAEQPTVPLIAKNVKFSTKFTQKEIEERWRQLLYDANIAKEASKGMSAIPASARRVLWSDDEERILIQEATATSFISFQRSLEKYRDIFHSSRTPKSLEAHFYRMKRTGTLPGSTPTTTSTSELSNPTSSTEKPAETNVSTPVTANVQTPTTAIPSASVSFTPTAQQPVSKEPLTSKSIKEIEAGLPKDTAWKIQDKQTLLQKQQEYQKLEEALQRDVILLELELSADKESMKNQKQLALVRGKNVRFSMQTKEVILGRGGKDVSVDVDLSKESKDNSISRKQAIIELKKDAEFYIKNIGKSLLWVNGKPVEFNKKKRLTDLCLVEIGKEVRFIFEINKPVYNKIKKELFDALVD